MSERLSSPTYLVRRKVFTLAGGAFHFYDGEGRLVLYSKLKAFKLKEDIRLFTGEDMREELLAIHARKVLDISATYDVTDSRTGERVGAIQRKGMRSLLRDEWILRNAADQEIGLVREDSMGLALLRRFLTNLVPQRFDIQVMGQKGGHRPAELQSVRPEADGGLHPGPDGAPRPAPGAGRRPPALRGRGSARLRAERTRSFSSSARPLSRPSTSGPGRQRASR